MNIDISDWFEKLNTNNIKPSICFYIGEMGTGKKRKLLELTEKYGYTVTHLNWLHNKHHSSIKKKTFVQDLKHIITNRNIEFFLTGSRDIVIIHNIHIMNDKALFDEINKMNMEFSKNIVTPVIFIVNQTFVSERLLTHMTKSCYLSFHKRLMYEELSEILVSKLEKNNIKDISKEDHDIIIESSKGNIFSLITQTNNLIITGKMTSYPQLTKKVDKNIVMKCFEELCGNGKWSSKHKFIKPHESLMRLLMPNHIAKGLDLDETITFEEKLKLAEKSTKSLLLSENVMGKYVPSYSSLLQCIGPTLFVKKVSIKTMVLSNCQSTNSNTVLEKILYPHSSEQYAMLLQFLCLYIEKEQGKLSFSEPIQWNKLIPNISKSNLNELQQIHLKIFKEHNITKKMVNKFVTRMCDYIPSN